MVPFSHNISKVVLKESLLLLYKNTDHSQENPTKQERKAVRSHQTILHVQWTKKGKLCKEDNKKRFRIESGESQRPVTTSAGET